MNEHVLISFCKSLIDKISNGLCFPKKIKLEYQIILIEWNNVSSFILHCTGHTQKSHPFKIAWRLRWHIRCTQYMYVYLKKIKRNSMDVSTLKKCYKDRTVQSYGSISSPPNSTQSWSSRKCAHEFSEHLAIQYLKSSNNNGLKSWLLLAHVMLHYTPEGIVTRNEIGASGWPRSRSVWKMLV